MILAIDPGPAQSGYVHFEAGKVVRAGVAENEWLLTHMMAFGMSDRLCIETMQATYGIVGQEVIDTLVWIGRFQQQWHMPREVKLLSRQEVKGMVCNGNTKATDAAVRQALIDKLGPPGSKKNPGPTYGVTSHAWAALAVAVACSQERGFIVSE